MAIGTWSSRTNRVASAWFLWGRWPSIGFCVWCTRTWACDCGNSWNWHQRLETKYRISRRLSRLASSHNLVLACDWTILERTTAEIIAIRDRNELNSHRWLRKSSRFDRAASVLHRKVGKTKFTATRSHLFQPVRKSFFIKLFFIN